MNPRIGKKTSGQQKVNTSLFKNDIATVTQNLVETKYLETKRLGQAIEFGKSIS